MWFGKCIDLCVMIRVTDVTQFALLPEIALPGQFRVQIELI